jgi:hypothetical protein
MAAREIARVQWAAKQAVKNDDSMALRLLFQRRGVPGTIDADLLLSAAARAGNVDIIRTLLVHGKPAFNTGPALYQAALVGNGDVASLILQNGRAPPGQVNLAFVLAANICNGKGGSGAAGVIRAFVDHAVLDEDTFWRAAEIATKNASVQELQELMRSPFAFNTSRIHDRIMLFAYGFSNVEIAEFYYTTAPNKYTLSGESARRALKMACQKNNASLAKNVLRAVTSVENPGLLVRYAVTMKSLAAAAVIIRHEPTWTEQSIPYLRRLLTNSSKNGNTELMKILLGSSFISGHSAEHDRAVESAAKHGQTCALDLLLADCRTRVSQRTIRAACANFQYRALEVLACDPRCFLMHIRNNSDRQNMTLARTEVLERERDIILAITLPLNIGHIRDKYMIRNIVSYLHDEESTIFNVLENRGRRMERIVNLVEKVVSAVKSTTTFKAIQHRTKRAQTIPDPTLGFPLVTKRRVDQAGSSRRVTKRQKNYVDLSNE